MSQDFTLFAVVQDGRLAFEALLLAASLAKTNPDLTLTLAEPQPGPLWEDDPRIDADIRAMLEALGAQIVPVENKVFGSSYPHGNKIEALLAMPADKPFLFLDTDTLVLGDLSSVPFDFDRPTASLVIHKLGGGRDTLPDGLMDGAVTCHYRTLSLLYAREGGEVVAFLEELAAPNRIKKLLKPYEAARKLIYQGGGEAIGHLFASGASGEEMEVRKRLKAAGLWYSDAASITCKW